MPPRPQDPKNAKQVLRHLHASYNGLVAFLRAHGALLAPTRTRARARARARALALALTLTLTLTLSRSRRRPQG